MQQGLSKLGLSLPAVLPLDQCCLPAVPRPQQTSLATRSAHVAAGDTLIHMPAFLSRAYSDTGTHLAWCAALPKLAFANPALATQWHPTENAALTPADVSVGSSRNVTWLCTECPCGHPHIWQAAVGVRARRLRSGCPFCAGKRPCVCKSLARLRPDVAIQWDYPSNAPLRPDDVTLHSNKRVTWFCAAHPKPHR